MNQEQKDKLVQFIQQIKNHDQFDLQIIKYVEQMFNESLGLIQKIYNQDMQIIDQKLELIGLNINKNIKVLEDLIDTRVSSFNERQAKIDLLKIDNDMSPISDNQDSLFKQIENLDTVKKQLSNLPESLISIQKLLFSHKIQNEQVPDNQSNEVVNDPPKKPISNPFVKLTLSLIQNIISTLQQILPNYNLNLAQLLYPNYDNIMGILIELLALLGKPYKPKDLSEVVNLFYQILNYSFKINVQKSIQIQVFIALIQFKKILKYYGYFSNINYQIQIIQKIYRYQINIIIQKQNQNLVQNQKNHQIIIILQNNDHIQMIKTVQDHVLQIMNNKHLQQSQVIFIAQSELWTKKMKLKVIHEDNSQEATLQLFPSTKLQKFLISQLIDYVKLTEQKLDKPQPPQSDGAFFIEFSSNKSNLEQKKYIHTIRIINLLCIILLSDDSETIQFALAKILSDLNIDNYLLKCYLKQLILKLDFVNINLYLLKNFSHFKLSMAKLVIEILLELKQNQIYPNIFKDMLCQNKEIIDVLYKIFQSEKEVMVQIDKIADQISPNGNQNSSLFQEMINMK